MKFHVLITPWEDDPFLGPWISKGSVKYTNPVGVTVSGSIYVGSATLMETNEGVEADIEIEDKYAGVVENLYPEYVGTVTRPNISQQSLQIDRIDLQDLMFPPDWNRRLNDQRVGLKCECGGAKMGYPPGKIGHSNWCPVARDID